MAGRIARRASARTTSAATTVHAIFDFGDRYAICVPDGHEMVTKRQTYAVFAFDA